VAVAALVGRRAVQTDIVQIDLPDIQHVEPLDHRPTTLGCVAWAIRCKGGGAGSRAVLPRQRNRGGQRLNCWSRGTLVQGRTYSSAHSSVRTPPSSVRSLRNASRMKSMVSRWRSSKYIGCTSSRPAPNTMRPSLAQIEAIVHMPQGCNVLYRTAPRSSW